MCTGMCQFWRSVKTKKKIEEVKNNNNNNNIFNFNKFWGYFKKFDKEVWKIKRKIWRNAGVIFISK